VDDGPQLSDGDLVRLARGGDPVAFRLLVERHQSAARARARRLCPNPSDVDDTVQESFLQAFIALDGLREPDRFAGWLAGIVLNVCRRLHRGEQLTLLPDWPEPLHPTSADGQPSADDLDRADALREAVADLPAGQRRAVALHYYADLPPGQIAEPPGAARVSLHKARTRLRAYITEHRPDLVPARRTHMTTVRIARAERRIPPGPVPDRFPTHVIVLADDARRRELPIWLLGRDSHRFSLFEPPGGATERAGTARARTPDELTDQLLRAAGTRVTGVDIDELGPEVTVARVELAGPAGTRRVTARLPDGLAVAVTAGAPIRVADAVMGRLAVPTGAGGSGPVPEQTARDLSPGHRPRYEPRNLAFADGLDRWLPGGSFTENALQSHWQDYACAAEGGTAMLSSAVPQPEGFALLGQEIYADDYHGAVVVFRGQVRTEDTAGRAGLFLRVRKPVDVREPLTEEAVLADPANHIVMVDNHDWASREVTARIPGGANTILFGCFLAGPGRIELRDAELTREPDRGLRPPDAGIRAVEPADELRGHDLEAGRGQHRLEQPAVRAELGADVLGVVLGGVSGGGIACSAGEPALEHPGRLGRAEVVDQVAQPEHAARAHHVRDPVQGHCLPEVGQLVQGVAGVHAIRGRAGALVAEEPGPDAVQVRQPRGGGPLAEHRDHGRRDVHRHHVPEPARRGERELPGPRTQVHDGGTPVQTVRLEDGQVLGRVGIALLAVVTRHKGGVEMFGPRVRQFVDHPGLVHEAILPASATRFPVAPRSTDTI